MVLPAIAIIIITAVVSLFSLGGASVLFPELGSWIWAGIFLLAAYFIPDFILYSSERVHIGLKSIFGLFGLGIIVVMLLGIKPSSFFSIIAVPMSIDLTSFDISTITITDFAVTLAVVTGGILILDKIPFEGKF